VSDDAALSARISDRVRIDLDRQLTAALAEVDRLRAAITFHRSVLEPSGEATGHDRRLWAVLERGDDR
jgi:hypothetical protein